VTYGIALGMFLIWVCGVLAGALRGGTTRQRLEDRLDSLQDRLSSEIKNNSRLNSELNILRERMAVFERKRGAHGRFVSR